MEFAAAVWGVFGWRWIVVFVVFYGGCLVGANSPQTFKRSRRGLERIAEDALAKARELALRES